jgi:hypothetical protein
MATQYTFTESDYESDIQKALANSLESVKIEEFKSDIEEKLLKKLNDEALLIAITASLEQSEGDKKGSSLLARRGISLSKLTLNPKIHPASTNPFAEPSTNPSTKPSAKPSAKRSTNPFAEEVSTQESEFMKTTRC